MSKGCWLKDSFSNQSCICKEMKRC